MAIREFRLPDPGEGLVEADIVTWRVAVGDQVKINDIVVEVETSKSLVELPSPYAGTVTSLLVNEGDTVDVGRPIIAIDDGVPSAAPAPKDDLVPARPRRPRPRRSRLTRPATRRRADGSRTWSATGRRPPKPSAGRGRRRRPIRRPTRCTPSWRPRPSRPMRRSPGGPTDGRRCTPAAGTAARRRPPRYRVRARRHPRRNGRPARSWPSHRFASWPRISELILVR